MGAVLVEIVQAKEVVVKCLEKVGQRVIGQREMTKKLLVALLAGGHALVEGVPGIAKTLAISTMAQVAGLPFKRIQFTPDLLPSDLTGMSIFRPDRGVFEVEKGPVFTNVVLADEINRAPPKVQSALLEVMAEKQVTIFGQTFVVPPPYFVMATQNPIEQEGTYPLPEAQLDRFMLKILVSYPSHDEELAIAASSMIQAVPPPLDPLLTAATIVALQDQVDAIHIEQRVIEYVVELVTATRDRERLKNYGLGTSVQWGASPRATLWLVRGARALALCEGRDFVTPHDVQSIAYDVLRHRIILSYEAQADGISSDTVVARLIQEISSP